MRWREHYGHCAIIFLLSLFLYSRLIGLNWGLPFAMHPDERNMVVALQGLKCPNLNDCFNPHFFAYGQFPLYIGYGLIMIWHFVRGLTQQPIDFNEATMSLRLLSVIASCATLFFLVRIVHFIRGLKNLDAKTTTITILLFTFVPYGIQFAHFGTTESLLMAFYAGIIFYSLRIYQNKQHDFSLYVVSLLVGLAIATKLSSLLFAGLPALAILTAKKQQGRPVSVLLFVVCAAALSVLFSPHNVLSFNEFQSAINYEIQIGQGTVIAFYNRQFQHTIPVLFQARNIFPYALGVAQFILAGAAFFLLPFKRKYNLPRAAFLIFFIPTAFLYAKWARFIAPVMPVATIFAILGLLALVDKIEHLSRRWLLSSILIAILLVILIVPGIAYLSVYTHEDVRITASKWIVKNIPDKSLILSETANVVDIPLMSFYAVSSFDFYHIDENAELATALPKAISMASYIFVPSRRIYANHTCFRFVQEKPLLRKDGFANVFNGYDSDFCKFVADQYSLLNEYYDQLFSGDLGYRQVAEITSFPQISLLGRMLYEARDENAEETWTVFDHPVIRIYKRR